jgi:hypothetical protein
VAQTLPTKIKQALFDHIRESDFQFTDPTGNEKHPAQNMTLKEYIEAIRQGNTYVTALYLKGPDPAKVLLDALLEEFIFALLEYLRPLQGVDLLHR